MLFVFGSNVLVVNLIGICSSSGIDEVRENAIKFVDFISSVVNEVSVVCLVFLGFLELAQTIGLCNSCAMLRCIFNLISQLVASCHYSFAFTFSEFA